MRVAGLKVVLDVATIHADLEPVRGFSSFLKKKISFFWRVDTPLQVFPVHTPVRRGQSGTLSQGSMVPGQLRRALALNQSSTHPSGQLVCMSTRTVTHELGPEPWRRPQAQHARALKATRDTRGCLRGRGTRMLGSDAADEWRM